jgi:hypothetical protein
VINFSGGRSIRCFEVDCEEVLSALFRGPARN